MLRVLYDSWNNVNYCHKLYGIVLDLIAIKYGKIADRDARSWIKFNYISVIEGRSLTDDVSKVIK